MGQCHKCERVLDSSSAKAHEYKCTNCGVSICEVCHYDLTLYRKKPKAGESNCRGVKCPKCKEILHFEEM